MQNNNSKFKILEKSISEISDLLDNKKISSTELTEIIFRQIEEKDKSIMAFITLCKKEALNQAKESDKRIIKKTRLSKIDGIPISLKDNICINGIKTTAGSKMLKDFIPYYDATIAQRLKNNGAVIIGKTNLDAWAHGSSTENSDFFTTHNPYDVNRVPGGSSGGSCAAVASNMGFASVGTDTGGSIRQPAGFCGVVGLKPTYGRVSRYGLVAMASSLDQAGPITKTSQDAAILLEIMCGHDPKDSTTVKKISFSEQKIQNKKFKIQNLKIGLPKEYFSKGLDARIGKKINELIKKLEKSGAKVKEISLPMTDYALATYYIIQPAEVSSNLARYDGIRYGFSVAKAQSSCLDGGRDKHEIQNLEELYLHNRAEGFGTESKRRIMLGTYVLSSGYYDAYYKKAMKVRTLVANDFKKVFDEVDLIITPTSPTLPFKIGEKEKDPISMYLSDVYTVSANIAGIPAISIPAGFVDKLPFGMQILGSMWSEELILSLANYCEKIK